MAAPETFWENFNKQEFYNIECSHYGSLAAAVLSYYNIGCKNSNIGGPLADLDIKHMDALQLIKLSLMDHASKTGDLYEISTNEDGDVEFILIGARSGGTLDVYHTIQTKSYVEKVSGVMVTGGTPEPIRKPATWVPIWGDQDPLIYDAHDMASSCTLPGISQHAIITFNDPHMDSNFEDGLDNLYEITKSNPWDRILGYAYYTDLGSKATVDTTSSINNQCVVPYKWENFQMEYSKMQRRPTTKTDDHLMCFGELGDVASTADGYKIELPTEWRYRSVRNTIIDKFMGVTAVYLIGQPLEPCFGQPISDSKALENSQKNTQLWVAAKDITQKMYKLEEGIHYTIAYDTATEVRVPYLVWGNNSRTSDYAKFGKGAPFRIYPNNPLYTFMGGEGPYTTETVFPINNTEGILVEEVWLAIALDTHCITITDPKGQAYEIAQEAQLLVHPLVAVEEPAPVAFNGDIINMSQNEKDHDPTTTQNFSDTDFERALDQMEGGGVSLNFSFMGEDEVKRLSSALYDYMNGRDGVVTTYVCGPTSTPVLGGTGPAGGIINEISYSYSDRGSYTISVNEGPFLVGQLSEITGGAYVKQVEEVGSKGVVIDDAGNHVNYKVRIDGYGERWAINMQEQVLRVGDIVNCSVHNVPVED